MSRHLRANSDPLSRGGAFPAGASGQLSQETNPFELGFAFPSVDPSSSQRRARSTSPLALVPGAGTPGGTKLPPLSLMDTPGGILGSGLTPFGWPSDSLRTGPLSPALLTGPSNAMNQAAAASLFTPGTTAALQGVGNAVSFPPPSPATAALFAMMTHATPVTTAGPAGAVVANGHGAKAEGAAVMPGMEGGGPRPHEGPNEGNAFEASFARAASSTGRDGSGSVPPPPPPGPGGVPFSQPNQQRGSVAPNAGPQQGRPLGPPQQNGGPHPPQPQPYGYPPPGNGGPVYAPSSLGPGVPPPAAFGGAQNPLYLLSQASQHPQLLPPGQHPGQPYPPGHGPPPGRYAPHHQTMPQPMAPMQAYAPHPGQPMPMGPPMGPPPPHMQDEAAVAAAALSGLGGYGMAPGHVNGVMGVPHPQQVVPPQAIMAGVDQGQSPATSASGSAKGKRGSVAGAGAANKKRKSNGPGEMDTATPPAPAKGKAPAAAAATKKGGKKAAAKEEEDHSDDDDKPNADDLAPPPANHSEMTEEEKRKNFLERNRQAALKCRQRKKAWLASLQTKVESLTQDNEGLQATVQHLTDEIASLRAILAAHRDCPTAQGAMNGAHQQQGQY